jgi:hypothetical protein
VAARVKGPPDRGVWAITSYFNPAGYRSRLHNYRIFRQRLAVPLLTVELSFGPDFELAGGDADLLVQVGGGDVMWQKERLLNLALRALPPECETVAWIDCDVVLARPDWPAVAVEILRKKPIIQLFHQRYSLPRGTLPEDARADDAAGHGVAYLLAHGLSSPELLAERWGVSLGLGWAARRQLLASHGFYDAGVLGGGDRALACAVFGELDALRSAWKANQRQMEHYAAWARPFHGATRGEAGYVDGAVFHLWHGRKQDRRYAERFAGFERFAFDPFRDVAMDGAGCWRWKTDKAEMHRYVREYLGGRREDD